MLFSGRTHQLRVHCDHIGHTIVGDYTYSLRQDTKPLRMMLHSQRLITDMDIETLDIHSSDPFETESIPEWIPQDQCWTYDEAVKIAENFNQECPSKDVKLVQYEGQILQTSPWREKT